MTGTRGHIDIQDRAVRWRGLSAVYSLSEEAQMRGLPENELLVLHTLKALFGGEIMDPADDALRLDEAVERLDIPMERKKGPAPTPRRRRNEPLEGQTEIAA